jgi:hypothetical protein
MACFRTNSVLETDYWHAWHVFVRMDQILPTDETTCWTNMVAIILDGGRGQIQDGTFVTRRAAGCTDDWPVCHPGSRTATCSAALASQSDTDFPIHLLSCTCARSIRHR